METTKEQIMETIVIGKKRYFKSGDNYNSYSENSKGSFVFVLANKIGLNQIPTGKIVSNWR